MLKVVAWWRAWRAAADVWDGAPGSDNPVAAPQTDAAAALCVPEPGSPRAAQPSHWVEGAGGGRNGGPGGVLP